MGLEHEPLEIKILKIKDSHPLKFQCFSQLVPFTTLVIPGNLATNVWWEPAIQNIKSCHFENPTRDMILAEWRGYGLNASLAKKEDFNLKTLAYDYIHLLNSLKIDCVDVIAHSTGGLIAIVAMTLAPERFRKCVLLDSVGLHGFHFTEDLKLAFKQMSRDRDLCRTVLLGTMKKTAHLHKSFIEKITDGAFHASPLVWEGVPHMLTDVSFEHEAKSLTHEFLILHGQEDQTIPLATARETYRILSHARLEVIEGIGHCLNVEDPELLVKYLNDFLWIQKVQPYFTGDTALDAVSPVK